MRWLIVLISRIRFKVLRDIERKPKMDEIKMLADEIDKVLNFLGFRSPYGSMITDYGKYFIRISNVRLDKTVWGLNVSPYQEVMGFRTPFKNQPILNYWQWGIVNVAINVILDVFNVSANVRSLNGLFVIREKTEKKDFYDWSIREDDNIGSFVYPIMRYEAWKPKDERKFSKAVDNAEIKLLNYVENSDLLDLLEIHDYITVNFRYIRRYCPFYVNQEVLTNEAQYK